LKSKIIQEEKEFYTENIEENKNNEQNITTFEKKFKLSKGERLIDSFTCAISKKILLHGRLYITNQRL